MIKYQDNIKTALRQQTHLRQHFFVSKLYQNFGGYRYYEWVKLRYPENFVKFHQLQRLWHANPSFSVLSLP